MNQWTSCPDYLGRLPINWAGPLIQAKPVATYRGRPITDLTRDELLVALNAAIRDLQELREALIQEHQMEREFRDAYRALDRR